jgi:hypothetical protein
MGVVGSGYIYRERLSSTELHRLQRINPNCEARYLNNKCKYRRNPKNDTSRMGKAAKSCLGGSNE